MKQSTKELNRRNLTQSKTGVSFPVALALTVGFYAVFVFWLFPDSYFAELFSDRGWIPYVTTLLFCWGLFMLMFSFMRIRHEENTLAAIRADLTDMEKINRETSATATQQVQQALQTHKGLIVSNRFLRALRRVHDGIKNRSEISDMLRDQADVDYAIVQTAHAAVRYFIWVIPVLGFIGTVLGISSAVGGFASIIENASDYAAVKENLGAVSKDLGIAFDTTFLALIKTALLMYFFSTIQRRERALLIDMDEFCADDLMRRIEPVHKVRDEKTEMALLTEVIEGLTTKISTWDPQFSQTLDDFFTRSENLSQRHMQGLSAIGDKNVSTLNGHQETFKNLLNSDLQQRKGLLESHSQVLTKHAHDLSAVVDKADSSLSGHQAQVASLLQSELQGRKDLLESHLKESGEQAERFEAIVQSHLNAAQTHHGEVQHSIQQALSDIQNATDGNARAANSVAESVERMATSVNQIGALQTTLQENLKSLTALEEFNRCLDQLRTSVEQLPGVLRELKRPREIRLIETVREEG